MGEISKFYNNGRSATKLLSHMIWRTLNDHPLDVLHHQEYGANKGAGEIPLIGKGAPLTVRVRVKKWSNLMRKHERVLKVYMKKYYNVSSIRMMRFLYSLGFEKESYYDINNKEKWRFELSSNLLEAVNFYKYMRHKNLKF